IGVLRRGEGLPLGAAFWTPASEDQTEMFGQVVARPRDGATSQAIAAELDGLSPAAANMRRGGYRVVYRVLPLEEQLFGSALPALRLLAVAAELLFLTACANVASLTLARALERRRELGVRIALGASRRSLMGLVLTENALLAAAGVLLALAVAVAGTRAALAFGPQDLVVGLNFTLQRMSVIFAVVLGVVAALTVSLGPTFVAGRDGVQPLLSLSGSRTGRGRASLRARRGLVVAQLAVAVLLMTSAGRLIQSIANLTGAARLGFEPARTVIATLRLVGPSWRDAKRRALVIDRIMTGMHALPGAQSTAYGPPPLVGGRGEGVREGFDALVSLKGPVDMQGQTTWLKRVDAGYTDTYGLRILAGRGFTTADSAVAQPRVLLNATAARTVFGTIDVVGRTFELPPMLVDSGAPPALVVGVLADAPQRDPTIDAAPELLLYARAKTSGFATLAVRSTAPAPVVITQLRQMLRDIDPTLAPMRLETMMDVVDVSLARHRSLAFLLGAFATLALTLASIGLYAVVSYLALQRRPEIGIQLALGAQRRGVFRLVLSEGLVLVVVGAVIGAFGGVVANRLLTSFSYGVSDFDVSSFALAPAILAVVAIAATSIPALRASRVDPAMALRAEQ